MTDSDSIESWTEKAKKAFSAKDYALAGKLFLETAQKNESAGNALQAAEMRNNASVALLKAGRAVEALTAVAGTPAIFEKAGDSVRQGMALGNQAAAYEDLHRLDEALRDYRLSAELLKGSSASEMRGLVLKRIAGIQVRNKKPVHALFAMDAAIDSSQKRSLSDRLIRWLMRFIRKLLGQT